MAATGATLVTMLDIVNVSNNNEIQNVIFPLTKQSDLAKQMPMIEATDLTSSIVTRNGALVTGVWADYNEGIDASKGGEKQYREVIGNLESRLEIDTRLLKIQRDREKFMSIKERGHADGLANDMQDALVTGSVAAGNHFDGIEARLNSLSLTDAFGETVVHTYGGTGTDLTSILLVQWGEDQVHGIYPRGGNNGGFDRTVYGVERVTDSNSKAFHAYVIGYEWHFGLVIADDRCVRRIANIETAGSSNNLLDSSYEVNPLIDALVSMKGYGNDAYIYLNRTVWGQLWKTQKDKTNVDYKVDNPWKSPERNFDGNPIGFTDALGKAETAIS